MKILCYNFVINKISDYSDLVKVFRFLLNYTDILSVGLEKKATYGSDHVQGFLRMKSTTNYSTIKKELDLFLKKNNLLKSTTYFTKVVDAKDTTRCVKYTLKENNYLISTPQFVVGKRPFTQAVIRNRK